MLSSIYKVGDLYTYNNRIVPELNDTLVLILANDLEGTDKHVKIQFLKNGLIAEACWIGHLLPIEADIICP